MTEQHPITPPPELVEQWHSNSPLDRGLTLATAAAQWGADQELEACCKTFEDIWDNEDLVTLSDLLRGLRAARRPQPTSLKELALARTDAILNDPNRALLIEVRETLELNRRALNELPE